MSEQLIDAFIDQFKKILVFVEKPFLKTSTSQNRIRTDIWKLILERTSTLLSYRRIYKIRIKLLNIILLLIHI